MEKVKVSVIIPIKQLTYYLIFENLPAFEKQTYNNFEVIVLPNEHAQYDLTLLRKYKWLKIIPTGKIILYNSSFDVPIPSNLCKQGTESDFINVCIILVS